MSFSFLANLLSQYRIYYRYFSLTNSQTKFGRYIITYVLIFQISVGRAVFVKTYSGTLVMADSFSSLARSGHTLYISKTHPLLS